MKHIPVMLKESLEIFERQQLKTFFDGTLGAAGFAKALLEAHPELEMYYGCDQDENALALAQENLKDFEGKVTFVHSNFSRLEEA
ncbi:MAG: 16S rRNA (cytosine(1402)-N(4))-methyltransferase, partial [Chlamydiia bacterium]|nr:16S rRNA (cytosine(1402)-N(4))-methyltransferase [Chlamydiia bacterium]